MRSNVIPGVPRVWTIGDPEPHDHPDLMTLGDEHGPRTFVFELPCECNDGFGGWWCVEQPGYVIDWEDLLDEQGLLTEALRQ